MARIRKNLTFSPEVLARAEEVMRARGFDELSDFCAAIIREEYERRHPPVTDALREQPTPYPSSPQPAPKTDTANKVLGLVKESYPQPAKKKRAAHPKAPK